jgi:hypothetical protein
MTLRSNRYDARPRALQTLRTLAGSAALLTGCLTPPPIQPQAEPTPPIKLQVDPNEPPPSPVPSPSLPPSTSLSLGPPAIHHSATYWAGVSGS